MKKLFVFMISIVFTGFVWGQNIFFDGFETGNTDQTAIAGWTQESVTGTDVWTANSSLTTYNRTPRTGSFNAYLKYSNTRWMFKSVTLTGGTAYKLSFWATQDVASGCNVLASYGTTASAAGMVNPIIPSTAVIASQQNYKGVFTPATSGTYYIGIRADLTSSPWYISIDDISLDVALLPDAAPITFTATDVTKTSMTIGWTDNSTNETAFRVYRSIDGITYTQVGTDIASTTTAGTGTTYSQAQTGLISGTTYYYRIVSVLEGESAYLTGTQATALPDPLHGIYTIDNTVPTTVPMVHDGTGNFASFTDAINMLNSDGISAAVTFRVLTGLTFTEDCPAITATGTSTNTITFTRWGSGANPIISPTGTTGTADAGFIINGGDYFTFNGIDVTIATGSAVEYGYYIKNASALNGAQYNTIANSKITLNKANTSSRGISVYNATTPTDVSGSNSYNIIHKNTIENCYYGMQLTGNSGYPLESCVIDSNTVGASTANNIGGGSSATSGIRTTYSSNVSIFANLVRNVYTTGAVAHGIFLENGVGTNNNVGNNIVQTISTTSTTASNYVYGIRIESNTGAVVNAFNNMVSNLSHGITTASTTVSIRALAVGVSGGTGTSNIVYNSVYFTEDANPSSAALYINAGTVNVKNNILFNNSTGGATSKRYAIYRATAATITSNYNDLYVAAGTNSFIGYYTADQLDLPAWQVASLQDANSVSIDPAFPSATDLHLNNTSLNNLGTPVPGITTDIDGDTRNATTPDMGADEFTPITLDMSAQALVAPQTTGCYTAAETVTIQIKNIGVTAIDFSVNPTTVTVNVTGAVTQTLNATVNTGTLAPGATQDVNMATTLDMTTFGTYTFDAYTTVVGDGNASNDAMATATRTVIAPVSLPQSVDFTGFTSADLTTFFPNWHEATGTVVPAGTSSAWATGAMGGTSAKINLYTNTRNEWIVGPKFTAAANTLLTFKVAITDYNSTNADAAGMQGTDDKVVVKISTDCGVSYTDLYTFDATTTVAITNTLVDQYINLGAYAGQNVIIAFYASDGPNNDDPDYDFHIDDIMIDAAPACMQPSALTATNITTNSADLGWTENGTATTWNVELGFPGFVPGTGTNLTGVTGTTSNPWHVAGGTGNTSYEFYVQSDCGGTLSAWSGPYLFTTLCSAITTLPYTESFEGASFPPDCWTNTGWVQSLYGAPNTGTEWAYSNLSGSILTSPSFVLTNNSRLRYWYKVESASYPQDMNVLLSTDGINFTTTLANYVGIANSSYTEAVIDLSAYTGQTVTIRFTGLTGAGGFDYGVLVDDVTMEVIPSCAAPSALTATNITATSANLGWTENGSATLWNIELGLPGFTPGTGTNLTGVTGTTSNPWTAIGGTSNTTYEFYVQADCGGSLSAWAGPYSFTTLCDAVTTFPFTEDFTAGIVPPACWSEIITNTTENWGYISGFANVNYDYSQNEWLITPVLDFSTLTNPYVSFDWMMSYYWGVDPYNNYDLICKVSTNGGATWDSIWSEAAEGTFSNFTWATKTISLPTYAGQSNVRIAWQYLGNDGAQGAIDNIIVNEALVPSITSLGSTSGCAGSDLVINGTNLENATSVTIGGTAAVITLNTGTAITVTVGTGTTGTVAVTTLGGTATSTETFTVNPLPSVFTVSGGGTYCAGGTGVTITLDGSTIGVNYELSTTPVTTLAGTGEALNFGPSAFETGMYTVTAVNPATTCSNIMSGNATVTVNPSPTAVTATASSNAICEGASIDLFSSANSGDVAIVNVLTEDFETSVPPTGWANLNGGLGNVWTTSSYGTAHGGSSAAECKYNSSNAADAWLITPGLNFTTGSVYTIKYWEKTSASFPENLKVTIGTDQTIASQTVLQDLLGLQHADYVEHTITYTCTTTGTYYLGWNCYSAADQYFLDIDDISVTTTADVPASYSWTSLPAGFTSTDQNPVGVTPPTAGSIDYIVTASNSHGCSATASTTVVVDPCTGINENNDGITVSVVPNPSNGMFYLNVEGINEPVTLNIYSINGKVIYSEQVDNTGLVNKPIDLKSYPKGMYFLRLINNNMTHTEKIIIE
ncbi:MAG TPA: choice-of-anchor J domain-containing protein [Bacteroidales bacterium]|nr:choice-of-anchor J domain-containing protein [Bacteroidales bacterium]